MAINGSHRSWIFIAALVVVVLAVFAVSRVFRSGADRACPRPFPPAELAALLAWERGWPEGVAAPAPGELRALEDPADSEACARLRELLPDTLALGALAPQSAAFYQAGEVYVVPVVPNLRKDEIEAMERGEFGNERTGATFLFADDFTPLGVVAD